ncbi:MAG: GNAT family N-acetyltransferase [Ardenticatenales bacterium]|nr:GNAT family N-acetyltransferase [Ardenticatenales bacterium]
MLFMDVTLARRLEQNEALGIADYPRLLKELYPDTDAAWQEIAGGCAVRTGQAFPINRAVGLGMNGPITAAEIERVEHFYFHAALAAEVELCPLADASLMGQLGERGYRVVRFFNIQVRDLLSGDALPALDPAIEITESDDEGLWLQASTGLTAKPAQLDISYALGTITFHRPGVRRFLAWMAGVPVGSGALLIRDGLAHLFSASTLPNFRRRGVQQALLSARLVAAREAGGDIATVMTVPGNASQRNVQRAGFAIAYTKAILQRDP